MLWKERRASSRSAATIWRSMLSIRSPNCLTFATDRCCLVTPDPPTLRSLRTRPVAAPETTKDFMPLHGIDHVELYVGNALQSAFFWIQALGFKEVAYAGLETGVRDRASHVLQQGRIRIVLTGALRPE